MIICPNCNERIDDDSHYCDQCGQQLLFCNRCGKVGLGKRCTSCGGLMFTPEDMKRNVLNRTEVAVSIPTSVAAGIPALTLYNGSLNIRLNGVNGAIIGRRQGPYRIYFEQNMYVSGVHAQLQYSARTGWCITDKHSSNGTKVNQRLLQPDSPTPIKDGDIVSIANINLQASVK